MDKKIQKIFESIGILKEQIKNASDKIDILHKEVMQQILKKQNMKFTIVFIGDATDFYLKSILFVIVSIATFGLALPLYVYWSMKYFINNSKIISE